MKPAEPILGIPTNVITGFLGVGKTTAITYLLTQKPANERWAVLVNEFGEVGIDGSLFEAKQVSQQSVFISEVPGGCMCCAAGLPMQMALNMLLQRAQPDRLLIEPTGLGHPREVMEVLTAEHYRDALKIQSVVTMVDARKLDDKRYTENETFDQQLDIADVVVANKADLYEAENSSRMSAYFKQRFGAKQKPVHLTEHGSIDLTWLDGDTTFSPQEKSHSHHHSAPNPAATTRDIDFPESGYISIKNQGEGFSSQGWVFKPEIVFDRAKLHSVLTGVRAERAKGVFITNSGVVGFNMVDDVLTEVILDESLDSRIEVITQDVSAFSTLEEQLLACI